MSRKSRDKIWIALNRIKEAERIKELERIKEQERIKEEERRKQAWFCPICEEIPDESEMYKLETCEHWFHKECARDYLEFEIMREGKSEILCYKCN